MKVLVTGYSGFLGSSLVRALDSKSLILLGRAHVDSENYYFAEFSSNEDYSDALRGVNCVIHCAARVHVMKDDSLDPLTEFRAINTQATLNLAKQASRSGIKRFIFISSIKVNGESTEKGQSFLYSDTRTPKDDYGISKSEAEVELLELAKTIDMEVVIIRPPLVYGPGVKANFESLMRVVAKGIPLPFAMVTKNRRSMVSVANLVDLIITCIDHPKAANQVFLVSDGVDLSTADLIKRMSKACNKSDRMLPIPVWCFRLLGLLSGNVEVVRRVVGSLQVNIEHTKQTLNWSPPQTIDEAFEETAKAISHRDKH